jgi:hypothetical protein
MSVDGIPEDVREFIFESIDSIEQLSILLLLSATRERVWTAEQLSFELRTNPESTRSRLDLLRRLNLLEVSPTSPPSFRYSPSPDMDRIITALGEVHKVRPHKVYELIFSSLKRARKFLNAFTLPSKKEDDDV